MKKLLKKMSLKIRVAFVLVLMGGLIGFTHSAESVATIQGVDVIITNTLDNYFLDENDVLKILNDAVIGDILGLPVHELDLGALENTLELNPYIGSAEIFRDLNHNVQVSVDLKRPVARLSSSIYPDAYITSDGELLPVSEKFVSRVLLINCDAGQLYSKKEFWGSEQGLDYLKLVNFISETEFWKYQISEVRITKKGKIIMLPQVGQQIIEFGRPVEIESKFRNLEIFFTEILPTKGWNEYEKVNVEYQNQIIAK